MDVAVKNGVFLRSLRQKLQRNLLNISNDTKKKQIAACYMTSVTYDDEYLKKRFAGKVAICTASTTGIGYAAAERIAREGAKVVVCSRRQENVDNAEKRLRDQNLDVSGMVCHQAEKEDRQRLIDFTIKTYGGIDLLYAGAGVNPHVGHFLSVTEEKWEKVFDVNVKSTFLMIRECVPHMAQRGGGAIVTNSSAGAVYPTRFPELIPYSVSKACMNSLTEALAVPLGNHKIRINTVAPGPIKTKFLAGFRSSATSEEEVIKNIATVLNRYGDPDECGAAVAFLLSDDASFITGETLLVGGGVFMNAYEFSF